MICLNITELSIISSPSTVTVYKMTFKLKISPYKYFSNLLNITHIKCSISTGRSASYEDSLLVAINYALKLPT